MGRVPGAGRADSAECRGATNPNLEVRGEGGKWSLKPTAG